MTNFDDRKRGNEGRFVREQEFEFRTQARAAKLLGHWAAEKLGLSGDAVEAYGREVVKADMQEAGWEDVVRKVKADLDAAHVDCSEHVVRRTMEEYLAEARRQLAAEHGGEA